MKQSEHRLAKLAPDLDVALPRVKRRPRGKAFPKGHSFGLAQRFQKGKSGNPKGRPKSAEISKALRRLLADTANLPRKGRTYAEKIVCKWIALGLAGNASAISAIADRAEGRPNVAISLDGAGDNLTLILHEMQRQSLEVGPPEGQIREVLTDGQEN